MSLVVVVAVEHRIVHQFHLFFLVMKVLGYFLLSGLSLP